MRCSAITSLKRRNASGRGAVTCVAVEFLCYYVEFLPVSLPRIYKFLGISVYFRTMASVIMLGKELIDVEECNVGPGGYVINTETNPVMQLKCVAQ